MELKFFGNGSAFASSHTSAYFEDGKNLILIDLSAYNLEKIKELNLASYENIYVFITHMHSDHVCGLGLFVEHCYYLLQKEVYVVVPDALIANMQSYLRISGVRSVMYIITIAERLKTSFFKGEAIKTTHDKNLNHLSYGYVFYPNKNKIVYTGDTNSPEDFSLAVKDAKEFYCELSTNPIVKVHSYYPSHEEFYFKISNEGTKVFFMHVDDMEKAKEFLLSKPFIIVPVLE